MRYYHSGVNSYDLFALLDQEGVAGMVNANCVMQPSIQRALEDFPDVPLVLDSGAYQGMDDLDAYVEVLRHVHNRFEWCAGLDDLQSQWVTNERYLELTGLYFFNALWVYQLEGGEPSSHIRWARANLLTPGANLIGIGGCVAYGKRHGQAALMRRIEKIGQELSQTSLRAHFFGIGAPPVLQAFAGAEWFASADSTKYLAGKKGRKLYRLDGSTISAQKAGLALTQIQCAQQNIRQIERWARGAGSAADPATQAAGAAPLFQAQQALPTSTGDSAPLHQPPVATPRLEGRSIETFQDERGGRLLSNPAEAMPAAIGCEEYGDRRGVDW